MTDGLNGYPTSSIMRCDGGDTLRFALSSTTNRTGAAIGSLRFLKTLKDIILRPAYCSAYHWGWIPQSSRS